MRSETSSLLTAITSNKRNERSKERGWFWGLDDILVLYPYLCKTATHGAPAWNPGLVASRADKIVISVLFACSFVRNYIFVRNAMQATCANVVAVRAIKITKLKKTKQKTHFLIHIHWLRKQVCESPLWCYQRILSTFLDVHWKHVQSPLRSQVYVRPVYIKFNGENVPIHFRLHVKADLPYCWRTVS